MEGGSVKPGVCPLEAYFQIQNMRRELKKISNEEMQVMF
jgi:hypothetical protein